MQADQRVTVYTLAGRVYSQVMSENSLEEVRRALAVRDGLVEIYPEVGRRVVIPNHSVDSVDFRVVQS